MQGTGVRAIALLLMSGCTDPGRVAVRFIWQDAPSGDLAGLWIHAAVEERLELDTPGTRLGESVLALSSDAHLSLDRIPNGDHRVVIVEIRDGREREQSEVLYFGLSQPFSRRAGESIEVPVYLGLLRVPEIAPRGLTVKEASAAGFVTTPEVTVRIAATGASRIVVAKDPGLTVNRVDREARALEVGTSSVSSGVKIYNLPYDLNAGLCTGVDCIDGIRTVYAKIVNAQGYSSAIRSTQAGLDTQGPQVVADSATMVLIPPPGGVLSEVQSVKAGTRARVSITVDELVVGTPTVTARRERSELPWTLVRRFGPSFVFEHVLSEGGHRQGEYLISMTATDRAGNTTTSALSLVPPGFVVDTTSPEILTERMRYHRIPWGSASTGGVPKYEIDSSESLFEPGIWIFAYDREDIAQASVIGRGRATADGRLASIALDPLDRDLLYAAAVDDAGNVSDSDARPGIQASPVRQVSWTATLIGKEPGRPRPNPHRLLTTRALRLSLAQGSSTLREPARDELEAVDAPDQERLSVEAGAEWAERQGAEIPPARRGHAMAYDAVRGSAVLFGGFGVPNDTFEWDGFRWIRAISPSTVRPAERGAHAMTYDAARGRILLFGGVSPSGPSLDDTWAWDGTRWTELHPSARPLARAGHAMAYDAARGRVVLFGGAASNAAAGGLFDDTWEWDGRTWISMSSTDGIGPSARRGHAMAYDAGRARVVLFGGRSDLGTEEADTWEWDGDRWIRMIPADGVVPDARRNHAMAYDAPRGRILLFGGSAALGRDDTWAWDGERWVSVAIGDVSRPPARSEHAMAYDALRGHIVLFGGDASLGASNDTWSWDGRGWIPSTGSALPSPRSGHAMAYDGERARIVLFGGMSATSGASGTWEWDGSRWISAGLGAGIEPPPRSHHAMAYDAARGRVLLYGGSSSSGDLGDAWEWDGSRWNERIVEPSPGARTGHEMAYDARRRVVFLYGGRSRDDSWLWNGSAWTVVSASLAPPERSDHALAYDVARDRIVLFGGRSVGGAAYEDTWEWDGQQWIQVSPQAAVRPPRRYGHTMAYDARRGRVILFGGSSTTAEYDDTWEWDGSRWLEIDGGERPSRRVDHAMAHDAARGETIFFGGVSLAGGERDDTWHWQTDQRPGVLMTFDWASAHVDVETIRRLELHVIAGGQGRAPTGAEVDGAEMLAWDSFLGAWAPSGSTAQGVEAPADITLALPGALAQRLVTSDGEIRLLLQPKADRGVSTAVVSLDYVELTIDYRAVADDSRACGDGIPEPLAAEACDDGNTVSGDGCTLACGLEPSWSCSGEPSACAPCGNGAIEGIESCDDGNRTSADGCTSACRAEPEWACSGQPSACVLVTSEREVNDVDALAGETGLAGPGAVTVSGALSPPGDQDYYSFRIPQGAGARLVAHTYLRLGDAASSCGSTIDTRLTLLDGAGAVLTSNDDAGPSNSCSRIDGRADMAAANLSPGRYFLRVDGPSSPSTGQYFLDIVLE